MPAILRPFVVVLVVAACVSALLADSAVLENFTASSMSESGFYPPDTMGAVGPGNVVLLINGRYEAYSKGANGAPLSGHAMSLTNFFSNQAGLSVSSYAFDPRITYDRWAQRWYAVAVDGSRSASSGYLVAVSRTANPADGWNGARLTADPSGVLWADFPQLGFDADAVYISANMFPISSGSFQYHTYAIPKADLLQSTPTLVNRVLFAGGSHGGQPVDVLDNTGLSQSSYALWQDGSSAAYPRTISGSFAGGLTMNTSPSSIGLNYLATASNARQPDGTANMDVDEDRFSSKLVRVNGDYWGVQTRRSGSDDVLRWFRIDAATMTREQEGIISLGGQDLYYPSIAVNEDGRVVIGFTASGPNAGQYPSAYAVVGTSAGGVTSFDTPMLLQAGSTSYHRNDSSGRNRWGDYSNTSPDPADPNIFWTFQEYASGSSSWSVQASEIVTWQPGQVYWRSAQNGSFADSGRWLTGAAPGAADEVILSRGSTSPYTISFGSAASNARLSVRQGSVMLNLGGSGYSLTSSGMPRPSLIVGEYQGTCAMSITNGQLSAVDAQIGSGLGSDARLALMGASASLHASGSVFVGGDSAGRVGTGRLDIFLDSAAQIDGALRVYSGSTVQVEGTLSAGTLDLAGGRIDVFSGGARIVRANALAFSAGGWIDLKDNDLVLDYSGVSPLLSLREKVIAGRNSDWSGGSGITSTMSGMATTLGYAEASAIGIDSYGGVPIDDSSIIVKYTYIGDGDLDGDVDGLDVTRWAEHFTGSLSGSPLATKLWSDGDWDDDGDVDGVDVSLWAAAFTGSLSGSGLIVDAPGAPAEAVAFLAGMGITVVPEPGGLSCLVALVALLRRRSIAR